MSTQNLFGDLSLEATQQDVKTAVESIAQASTETPQGISVLRTQPAATEIDRVSFAKAISNGIDSQWGSVVLSGSGMTINQSGGNLIVTTGTTARSETIIRSNNPTANDLRFRIRSTLSQRIVNQTFIAELVDILGDGLAYNITSATSITVTFPSGHGLTAQNIGQSISLGAFVGSGTFLSGRYPIASVAGDNITFTVSAFAVGTGTLSAFGLNFYRLTYDGATATSAKFDTGRSGYATGDTTVTINTTASPGHLAIVTAKDLLATLHDQLVASATGASLTYRGSRIENVPTDKILFIQLRIVNGSTAPAATTTWTVGMVSATTVVAQDVAIQDIRPMSASIPLPVEIIRATTQTVTGTVTANQGTLVTPTPLNINSAATTNATSVKSSAGTLYNISASNINAAARYIKLYNKASAPTVGTDVPVLTMLIPAGSTIDHDFGLIGHRFSLGIALAITSGAADADTGAVAVGEIKVIASFI